jgi:hypothetical protein
MHAAHTHLSRNTAKPEPDSSPAPATSRRHAGHLQPAGHLQSTRSMTPLTPKGGKKPKIPATAGHEHTNDPRRGPHQLTFSDHGMSKISTHEHTTSPHRPENDCGHPRRKRECPVQRYDYESRRGESNPKPAVYKSPPPHDSSSHSTLKRGNLYRSVHESTDSLAELCQGPAYRFRAYEHTTSPPHPTVSARRHNATLNRPMPLRTYYILRYLYE